MQVKRKIEMSRVWSLVAIHVFGSLGIWYGYVFGYSLSAWITAGVFYVLSALGLSVGYHRHFVHESFKCKEWFAKGLAITGGWVMASTIANWDAHFQHHQFTDKRGLDAHTPLEFDNKFIGFLWAHMGWLFYKVQKPEDWNEPEWFLKRSTVIWQKKYYGWILVSSLVLPFLITGLPSVFMGFKQFLIAGLGGLMLAGFVRIMIYFHVMCCINSVAHVFGTKTRKVDGSFYTRDESRDSVLLSFAAMGEGGHGRHHAQADCAWLGWRWYHVDPGKWLLIVMEKLGVVWAIKRPRKV